MQGVEQQQRILAAIGQRDPPFPLAEQHRPLVRVRIVFDRRCAIWRRK